MNEFQFCYWLMGAFELDEPESFSAKQTYLTKEHLKLVTYRQYSFCNWLEGYLEEKETLNNSELTKILDKLRSEFKNIIDKSYPKEIQAPLQHIHDAKITTRC